MKASARDCLENTVLLSISQRLNWVVVSLLFLVLCTIQCYRCKGITSKHSLVAKLPRFSWTSVPLFIFDGFITAYKFRQGTFTLYQKL